MDNLPARRFNKCTIQSCHIYIYIPHLYVFWLNATVCHQASAVWLNDNLLIPFCHIIYNSLHVRWENIVTLLVSRSQSIHLSLREQKLDTFPLLLSLSYQLGNVAFANLYQIFLLGAVSIFVIFSVYPCSIRSKIVEFSYEVHWINRFLTS